MLPHPLKVVYLPCTMVKAGKAHLPKSEMGSLSAAITATLEQVKQLLLVISQQVEPLALQLVIITLKVMLSLVPKFGFFRHLILFRE